MESYFWLQTVTGYGFVTQQLKKTKDVPVRFILFLQVTERHGYYNEKRTDK